MLSNLQLYNITAHFLCYIGRLLTSLKSCQNINVLVLSGKGLVKVQPTSSNLIIRIVSRKKQAVVFESA